MHRLPVRIYGAELPLLDLHELRRNKITGASCPGVGTPHHHWLARYMDPNTEDHYHWNTSYITIYVAAVHPSGSSAHGILGETFGHLMQVAAA